MSNRPAIANRSRSFVLSRERLASVQALFYLVTGIWPLIHIRSFEAITGPKLERWLVKTVGILVAVIGATVGLAARSNRITPEMALLGAGSAAGLAAIDIVYVAKRRISPVYLLDAVAELVLVAAWARVRPRNH